MISRRIAAGWPSWVPALVVAAGLWPRIPIATLHEDQGVVTMWGLDVLAGRAPYRDFVVYTAPPLAYLYAVAFRLFGTGLVVDRLLLLLPMLVATVCLALIAKRLLPTGWAVAVALLWGAWLPAFIGYGAYHFWGPALVVAMAAALVPPRFNPLLAGVAGAAALLFYQGVAPGVAAGLLVAYLTRRDWRDLLAMGAGPLLAGLLLLGYLVVTGTVSGFFDQTLGFTFGRYQDFNRLPFPWNPLLLGDTLNWHSGPAAYWEFPMFWLLGVVAPLIVAGYALFETWRVLARGAPLSPVAAVAIISTGLLASAFVARVGGPVAWLSAPLALVLVAMRLRRITAAASSLQHWAALAPVLLLFVAGLSPIPSGWWLSCTLNGGSPLVEVQTAAGPVCLRKTDAVQLKEVQPVAAGASRVAFLPTSPGLYQLTGTEPSTPSYWVLPRHTRASELAWTESALLDHVGRIVYIDDPELDTGHPWQFDDFLAANYSVAQTYPGVTVYQRR